MDRDQGNYGTPASDEAVWEAVLAAREQIAAVAAAGRLGLLSDETIDGVLLAVEEVARLVPVLQQQLVAQVTDRGLDTARGTPRPRRTCATCCTYGTVRPPAGSGPPHSCSPGER